MPHIDPRREHRRAKMLDLANNSVKGSDGRGGRRWSSRDGRQLKRRFERSTYHHLRDFRCSGDVECECPGCSCESWTANDTWARRGRTTPMACSAKPAAKLKSYPFTTY